jgi:hypothetical protein
MSEAPPDSGSSPDSSPVRSYPVDCAVCGHSHRINDRFLGRIVIYEVPCACGCEATHYDYDGPGVFTPTVDKYGPTDYYDNFNAAVVAAFADDYADSPPCPDHHLAGACATANVRVGWRYGPRTSPVDAGSDMRRGRVDRFVWFCLSRFFGDLSRELVRQRGNV